MKRNGNKPYNHNARSRNGRQNNKSDRSDKEARLSDLDNKYGNVDSMEKRYKQDPFWYALDKTAVNDMASWPWNNVVGENIAWYDAVPGIVIANYYPSIPSTRKSNTEPAGFGGNYATRAAAAYFNYVTQGFTDIAGIEAPLSLIHI